MAEAAMQGVNWQCPKESDRASEGGHTRTSSIHKSFKHDLLCEPESGEDTSILGVNGG